MFDIIIILLITITSTFTSASGIGGGAITSVLLMYFNNFCPRKAFPISNFIILVSSLGVYSLGVKLKGEDPDYSFVDYDVVLIFIPMLALGAKIGGGLLRIIPSVLLDFILLINIVVALYKYTKILWKQWRQSQLRSSSIEQDKDELLIPSLKDFEKLNKPYKVNLILKKVS